jgi:hypothetical protein
MGRVVLGRSLAYLGLSLALAFAAVALSPAFADPESWSDDLRLTWTDEWSSTSYNNAKNVACDVFGNIHVVWTEVGYYFTDVYYMCRPAGGVDWTLPVSVERWFAHLPAVACDPWGNVHVVWCGPAGEPGCISYREYDGSTWGPIQRLTDFYEPVHPSIAADALGRIHVVWSDTREGNEDIYYKQFDGTSWGAEVRLTDFDKIDRYPAVAVDSQGFVHVAWVRNRNGWELFYKELSDSGWSERIFLEETFCNHPAIAIGPDDGIHLVWDGRGSPGITYEEIYYKERDGSGWSPKVRLTISDASSRYPSVEADVYGNIHVAWFDYRDGNDEIYYCIREGVDWGSAERITDDAALSQFPSIAADSIGSVHLVWWDTRDDSTAEVYYKQRFAPGAGLSVPGTPAGTLCQVEVSPNPARSEVSLAFWLDSQGPASLAVIDIAGRVVWRGSCAPPSQGWNSATWMCRDMRGQRVAPGIYLVRIQAGTSGAVAKVVVTK